MKPTVEEKLGTPKKINSRTFFLNNDEEEVDAFIVMLAAWFNDLKSYQALMAQAQFLSINCMEKLERNEKLSHDEEMRKRLSHSQSNHALRLIASHIVEFFEALRENQKIFENQTLLKTINNISTEQKPYWPILINLALPNCIPGNVVSQNFKKFENILIRMRTSGTYHYSKIKYFKKGYLHYYNNPANEPYYCSTDTVDGTRFFFADRVQEKILDEFVEQHPESAFSELLGIAQYGVKELVEEYIRMKSNK